MQKFPILAVAKEALRLPLQSPLDIVKALAMLAVPVAIIVLGILEMQEVAKTAMEAQTAGEVPDAPHFSFSPFLVFACFIAVFWSLAYIFNHWVRAGAFGPAKAAYRPLGKAWGAAGVTMIKFILISILLVIVLLVCWAALQMVGLAPSFREIVDFGLSGDTGAAQRASLGVNVIFTAVTCAAYSYFSANLTQTALGSSYEGFEHPHVTDFGVVLFLLYAIVLVPAYIAGLTGSVLFVNIVVYVIEFYIVMAIAAAHGIRYRFCVAEIGAGQDQPSPQA